MPSSVEENKELVRNLLQAKNDNDQAKIRELLAPDFVGCFSDRQGPIDREEYIKQVNLAHKAFKPLVFEIEDIICEKDTVAVRVLTKGKHTGAYEYFKATKHDICFLSIFMKKIADGKIKRVWQVSDHLTMLKQIGLSVNHII